MSEEALRSKWLDRFSLKMKLRKPEGIQLSSGETIALAEVQEEDVDQLKENQQEVLAALGATHFTVSSAIVKAQAAKRSALSFYKSSKNPIKKREWARRLVIAESTLQSTNEIKTRSEATRERLEMIKGDIELRLIEAEAKAAETRAYAKAGKQLRLVGQKLIDARTNVPDIKIEYSNLEINMENAEKLVAKENPDQLISQANEIARKVENNE